MNKKRMNKKLMAIAVAGALAAPAVAFAQASSVQIYGRANLGFDNYSSTGGKAGSASDMKSRNRIYDSSSRIGLRGTENLGGGLNAVFLMESGVAVDSGLAVGQGGQNNLSAGTLSSRVGHVGLQGNWGLLTFGRSNVWWGNGPHDRTAPVLVNASPGITTGTFGRGMGVGVTRVSNVMQYTSPVMSGMNAVISYSPGNASGLTGAVSGQEAAQAGANADGKLWGVTLQGTWGQASAAFDWTSVQPNTPAAAAQGKTIGTKLRGGWAYQPGASINLLWIRSEVDKGGGAGLTAAGILLNPDITANLTQSGWAINWEHTFGNFLALAQYGKVGDISGCSAAAVNCNNTNTTGYLLGGRYLLSKRTWLYGTYNQIRNDTNASQDFTGGAITSVNTLTAGAPLASFGRDPRVVALGMVHEF